MPVPDAAGSYMLLPASQTPPREAMLAHADSLGSDIFPDTYPERVNSVIGDYHSAALPANSPLQPLMRTLVARSHRLKAEERQNGYVPTAETESGLSVVTLQIYLAKCIDKGYLNALVKNGGKARIAFATLAGYIDGRDEASQERYIDQIGTLAAAQAKEESLTGRSDPVKGQQIRQAELRLERLSFEWLSARAIERTMQQAILRYHQD